MPKINTYTDNATIEDVDAVLTYDPSGSGATKLTTFARIASWVSAKLAALGKKTTISSADQILMVNGSAAARIDYNVLAKAIIEQYAGSTVAGSAQSVKAALDALNSKSIVATKSLTVDIGESFTISTASTNTYYFALLVMASNAGAAVNRAFWISGYGVGGPTRIATSLVPVWGDNGRYTLTISEDSNKITIKRATITGESLAFATLFVFATNRPNEILMEKATA